MHKLTNNIYFSLIRNNPDFRYLWLSQIVSLLGDWFNLIASAALVANLSNSGLAIGGLFIARLLPPFLLSPIVGVVADKFDRKKILIGSDVLRSITVLGFLLVQNENQIWLLYTLTIVQLSISAFFEPARAALLPSIVSKENIITANTLSGATWSTMLAFGAALGGLATALFGTTSAFLLDACTFLISAWFLIQMPFWKKQPTIESIHSESTGWQSFLEGLRYLWLSPTILVIALIKASGSLAYGSTEVVQVIFANDYFPLGDDGSGTLGLMYFTVGVGTGLGPIVARWFSGDNPPTMYWAILFSFMVTIVGYLLFGVGSTLIIILVGIIMRSIGTGINWVYSSSLLQMSVPNHLLGRVFAFDLAMVTLSQTLSTLWAGWATDTAGLNPHQISMIMAVISLLMTIGWAIFMFAHLRKRHPITL